MLYCPAVDDIPRMGDARDAGIPGPDSPAQGMFAAPGEQTIDP